MDPRLDTIFGTATREPRARMAYARRIDPKLDLVWRCEALKRSLAHAVEIGADDLVLQAGRELHYIADEAEREAIVSTAAGMLGKAVAGGHYKAVQQFGKLLGHVRDDRRLVALLLAGDGGIPEAMRQGHIASIREYAELVWSYVPQEGPARDAARPDWIHAVASHLEFVPATKRWPMLRLFTVMLQKQPAAVRTEALTRAASVLDRAFSDSDRLSVNTYLDIMIRQIVHMDRQQRIRLLDAIDSQKYRYPGNAGEKARHYRQLNDKYRETVGGFARFKKLLFGRKAP